MSLFEEIKMLIDLVDDGYITETEFGKLLEKKVNEKSSKKLDGGVKRSLDEMVDQGFKKVEVRPLKPVPFVKLIPKDGEISNLPYMDDKDDFDLWKERNNINEDEKFNRYVYKGEVYWMKAGSQEEKDLLIKIYDEKRLVDFPSDPLNNTFYLTRNHPKVDIGGRGILDCPSITSTSGWTDEGKNAHPMWGINNHSTLHNKALRDEVNAITIESLKGTIQSSEHNE